MSNFIKLENRDSRLLNMEAGYPLFIGGFSIWLVCRMLFTTNVQSSLTAPGLYLGLALCVLSEIVSLKNAYHSLPLIFVLFVLSIIAYRFGGMNILYLAVLAYTSRRYRFKDILEVDILVVALFCLAVVAASRVGLIDSVVSTESGRIRDSLGFGWPTYLSHYYLQFVIGYCLLRFWKLKPLDYLLLALGSFAVYQVTVSRASFYLSLVFLLFTIIVRKGVRGKIPFVSFFLSCSFLLCFLISIILFLKLNPYSGIGYQINLLLSNRIYLTQVAFNQYGISLFGAPVEWITTGSSAYTVGNYSYVDCSYINIAINYGWVFITLAIALLSILTYRANSKCGVLFGIAMTIFAIHSISDPQLLDLHYCVFLLLLGNVFDSKDKWSERLDGLLDCAD